MTWQKVKRHQAREVQIRPRRTSPCVSRSPKRPDMAYMMLPRDMAEHDSVSIYADAKGRIAFEFRIDGDYAVRQTSRTSYTVKVTIPTTLAQSIPLGLSDVDLERNSDGWLVLDPSTIRKQVV